VAKTVSEEELEVAVEVAVEGGLIMESYVAEREVTL
jgi:hypothetical protein